MKFLLTAVCISNLVSPVFTATTDIAALLEKARMLRQANRPAEGKPFAEQAMRMALKENAWEQLFDARQELSFEERLASNYDRVLQLRLANLDTVRSHREAFPKDAEEDALDGVCAGYDWVKDYESAVRYCRETLAASEMLNKADPIPGLDTPHALQRLGINLYLSGQYAEAEKDLREAYAKYLAFSQLTNNSQGIWNYETQVEVLRWLERVLVAENRIEQALEIAELGRSRALAASLASGSLTASSLSVNSVRTIAKEHQATVVECSLLYDYDPDMLFIFGNFEDTAVASIYLWVIQPSGEIVFRESKLSPHGMSLAEMVRLAHSSIGAYTRSVTVSPTASASQSATHPLQDLYNVLIAPIADDLPHDPAQIVTFVLQDWLFMVPFAALQDSAGHYLVEKHTISVSPSIDVLRLTHEELGTSVKGNGALVIGNPLMPSLVTQDGASPRQLNALPGAEREAQTIAALFRATPLLGQSATKDQVLRRLPNALIVHFATHGLLDQQTDGLQSALALSPSDGDNGLLTAREIQHLKLNSDLVVLSACNTALGKMSGDGIFGLSRSFLTAGVPSVIVSLWAISDESTAYLMEHFYQRMQSGQDKAHSLHGAMLDTKDKYPAPLNWAAFVLVGETSFAPASRSTRGNAQLIVAEQIRSNYFVFPLPQNIRGLRDDPNPAFGGTVSSVTYETNMTITEIAAFYKHEFDKLSLKEDVALELISPTQLSLVYRSWPDREAGISAIESDGSRLVMLGFKLRRDDDAEFPPATNEARSGLVIPEHATGVDVRTRFNLSTETGDVVFLSRLPSQDLRDLYRGMFQRSGFSEYSCNVEKRDGAVDCEYRGKLSGRALFLHIEKSFFHPERLEVKLHFDTPSSR